MNSPDPTVSTLLSQAAALHAQGQFGAAVNAYHHILSLSPHETEALHMLGVLAQQAGRSELALQMIDAALTVDPHFSRARINRCTVLRSLGRNDEALQSALRVLKAEPAFAEAWDIVGQILKDKGDYEQARSSFDKAIMLQPDNARILGNFALLLFAQNDLLAAYQMASKAAKLDPDYPPLLLGNILRAWGYPEKAAKCFARARVVMPSPHEAATNEAMARLQMGDLEQGWALWEQRLDLSTEPNPAPLWQGQAVDHLLLYEDQGMGDAIQFLRYLPSLKNRVGRLTLHLREPLLRLCAINFPDIARIEESEPAPKADARCRLSSLPFFFNTRLDNILPAPYLSSPDKGEESIGLDSLPAPRIGLVWAGNSKFRNDAIRSVPFAALQPLLDCGLSHFVSLQKDKEEDMPSELFDAAPRLHDFADTAALINTLDLVISVDTATAHLAGALGKPVFVLLPFNSDWRWLIEREDSPWYPTARLFRQQSIGDWSSVIAAVANEVKKLIDGDISVLHPAQASGENLRQNPNAISLPQ